MVILKKIIITSIFALLGLLVMEVFFKLTKFTRPTITEYNEELGTMNKANFLWVKFKEGFYIGRTNNYGLLHEKEPTVNKSATLKIGLIGDSFVAGDDVFSRDHFGRIFEDSLIKHFPDKSVDVLNFGRGNFSIASSYYYYKNYIQQFELDYILYFLESRDYGASKPRFIRYYTLEDNGELKGHLNGGDDAQYQTLKFLQQSTWGSMIATSCYLALVSRAIHSVKSRGIAYKFLGKFSDWRVLLGFKDQDAGSQWLNPSTMSDQEMPELTRYIIHELHAQSSPKVLFVTRHHPVKVPQLDDYLEEHNIPYISLSEVFEGTRIIKTGEDGHYFEASQSYGGHFNHKGHAATGAFLADEFKKMYDSSQ